MAAKQGGSAWFERPGVSSGIGLLGNSIREDETALCLDCHVTFNVRNRTCPKCNGEQFWLVAKWRQAPSAPRRLAAFRSAKPPLARGSLRLVQHAS